MKRITSASFLCLIYCVFGLSFVYAQSFNNYPGWYNYREDNTGLGNSQVDDIAIDSSGNQWYATRGGISEFNGSVWKVYTMSDYGVQYSWISKLSFDTKGNLWAVAPGYGLLKFDGTTWTNYSITNSKLPPVRLMIW